MEILREMTAPLIAPQGNIEMSQAVRYYLGQPLGYHRSWPVYEEAQHPPYKEDLKQIGTAMHERGYLGTCALGPEGSNSHILAMDIETALDERHQKRHWELEQQYRHDAVLANHPAYKRRITHSLVGDMSDVIAVAASKQPIYGRVGILPIANTLGGMVSHEPGVTNLTKILELRLRVLGVVDMAIKNCLLAGSPIDLDDLEGRYVYSHPSVLAQCQEYIERSGLNPRPDKSTSMAAARLKKGELGTESLVIGTSLASELYGLELVAEDIGNVSADQNITVMAVIAELDPHDSRIVALQRRTRKDDESLRTRSRRWHGNPI
jgi:prephenate dehydratase